MLEDAWTDFSAERVQEALPSDVRAHYLQWVNTYPDKEGRLEELVAQTQQLFRMAVASNPENWMDPDPEKIPVTGYQHAFNMMIFHLMMESGAQLVPEVYTLMTRADIWLRLVQRGAVTPSPRIGAMGSPSYVAPENAGVLP
ncbi:MAG: hypothetical protein JJU29_18485 [Verrucomicrobia bacterium]|nr:hypothetical protein [Verrucomicrobiota bacterium]MCH8512327.1 hypothetical protein [Kiritimatiellia bacterium]